MDFSSLLRLPNPVGQGVGSTTTVLPTPEGARQVRAGSDDPPAGPSK